MEGLGPFTVGSSLSEVAAVASRYEGVKRNAMDGSGSCVSYESEGWSALVVEKQLLWVDVTSKSVATTLGVRVGDTRETLSAKHPTATPHELDPNFYTVPFKGPNDLAVIVGENGLVDSLIVGRDETIAWGPFAEPCG